MYNWLSREPRSIKQFAWVFFPLLLFDVAWDHLLDLAINFFGFFSYELPTDIATEFLASDLFGSLLVVPLEEELLFRALPLWLVVRFAPSWALIPTVLLTSIVFGIAHGDLTAILFQGVGGITFSLMYLKCGGMRGAFIKPLLAAAALHSALNGWIELETLIGLGGSM